MQQVSVSAVEKRNVSLVKVEQENLALVNRTEDLSLNESAAKTKKSCKAERSKNKEERYTGTNMQLAL